MSLNIESILNQIRLSRREPRQFSTDQCIVCGGPDLWRREECGSAFCSELCNKAEFWFSELFQLGFKRKLEWSEVRKTIFSDLPPEIQGYILLMAYDYRIEYRQDWELLMALREFHFEEFPGEGAQLREMIDGVVIPNLKFVRSHLLLNFTPKEIGKFRGLIEIQILYGELEGEEERVSSGDWTEALISMKSLHRLDISSRSPYHSYSIELDLGRLTQLKSLYTRVASNEDVKKLILLEELELHSNPDITLDGIRSLERLVSLKLSYQNALNGEMVQTLTNITSLSLSGKTGVDTCHIQSLVNLKSLRAYGALSGAGLRGLSHLEILIAPNMKQLNDEVLLSLLSLKELDITYNREITDESISQLTRLETLVLSSSFKSKFPQVSSSLIVLTSITSLNLTENYVVRDEILREMVNLRNLVLYYNLRITDRGIETLTNLRTLNITKSPGITYKGLESLLSNARNLRFIELDTGQFKLARMERLGEKYSVKMEIVY